MNNAAVNKYYQFLRPLLLALLGAMIFSQIVFLSPTALEKNENRNTSTFLRPEEVMNSLGISNPSLVPNIPKDRIPEYTVDGFKYLSTKGEVKEWKLKAERAFLYNKERLVHGRTVLAYLYNPDLEATIVTGNEARYFMNERDLEIFGNVVTTFPDGFVIKSEYMRYLPDKKRIEMPHQYPVQGHGKASQDKIIDFTENLIAQYGSHARIAH